jgi:hypothetical protein
LNFDLTYRGKHAPNFLRFSGCSKESSQLLMGTCAYSTSSDETAYRKQLEIGEAEHTASRLQLQLLPTAAAATTEATGDIQRLSYPPMQRISDGVRIDEQPANGPRQPSNSPMSHTTGSPEGGWR